MHRLFGLDLLRALAIGFVFFGHLLLEFYPDRVQTLMRLRPDGVGLFFVLSGFLISVSLVRHLESGDSYPRFWLKRAVRTMPPFFVALAIYGVLVMLVPGYRAAPSMWSFVFLQNLAWPVVGGFTEGWSLSVEEWYYASFIALAALLPLSRHKRLLVAALTLLAVSLTYRVAHAIHPVTDFVSWVGLIQQTVLGRLDGPAMGVLAAYTYLEHPAWWRSNRVAMACLGLGLAGTWGVTNLGVAFFDFGTSGRIADWRLTYPLFFYAGPTIEAVGWALMLVPATRLAGPGGWLEAVVRQTARSAFSIYLTHASIVLGLLVPLFSRYRLLIFLVLSVVVSQAFYLSIERPAIRARRFFEDPVPKRSDSLPPAAENVST